MTTLVLLTKIKNNSQLKQIERTLKLAFEDLNVETKILSAPADRWPQLVLAGEDEGIAASYVSKEIGLCPASIENISKFSVLKGYITNLAGGKEELSVDVGILKPETVHATIPLRHLQAQLVDGRKIALRKIAELFGLCEDLPVYVKVSCLSEDENRIEAELSTEQIERYRVWRESLLDRLLVLGPSLHEIKMTMEHAKLERDIIGVENLGMFEHALTCKLGTDAAGLIPKIGRNLRNAKFAVFNPRRINAFLQVTPYSLPNHK
jgi:hypothetical protein